MIFCLYRVHPKNLGYRCPIWRHPTNYACMGLYCVSFGCTDFLPLSGPNREHGQRKRAEQGIRRLGLCDNWRCPAAFGAHISAYRPHFLHCSQFALMATIAEITMRRWDAQIRQEASQACDDTLYDLMVHDYLSAGADSARAARKCLCVREATRVDPLVALPCELLDMVTESIVDVRDMGAWLIATGHPPKVHHIVAALLRGGVNVSRALLAGAPSCVVKRLAGMQPGALERAERDRLVGFAAAGGRVDVYEWCLKLYIFRYGLGCAGYHACRALVASAWRNHPGIVDLIGDRWHCSTSLKVAIHKAVEVAVACNHLACLSAIQHSWPRQCCEPLITWSLLHDKPSAIAAVGLDHLSYGASAVFWCAVEVGAWRVARWLAATYPRSH
nr:hypothetical protein [Pandoravirus aubagnensis]